MITQDKLQQEIHQLELEERKAFAQHQLIQGALLILRKLLSEGSVAAQEGRSEAIGGKDVESP